MAKTATKTSAGNKPAAPASTSFSIGKYTFSKEEGICLGLLCLLLLIIGSIRSNFENIPFERDEGIYGYMGKLLIEGKTPYKDFQEQKFPGLFYFYGGMVYLFGDTVRGMHTGFMYLNMLSTVLIYFTSRKLFSPVAGIISATTFAFVSLTPNLSGFTIQAEHGVAFFICLGLFFYALYATRLKWYYILLMGLAFGLAFMTKTSGVFLVLWGGLVFIIDFLFNKDRKFKDLLIQAGIYSAAVFFVVGIFFFIIYIKGSFDEMIYWAYETPKNYVNKMPFEEGIKYFKYTRDAIVQNHKFFWVHSFLAVLVCFLKSISWRMKFTYLLLLGFSFCTIVPGFYFYGHYWIQTIPGLAILSGLTYFGLMQMIRVRFNFKQEWVKYAYLGLFGIFTFKHVSALKPYYFHPNYDVVLRSVYGTNPFPESMVIANYINANSTPADDIVLIGSEPQIYFYTKKKCASRYAYFAALVDNVPEHHKWQREFVADVEKQKPRYLVFFNHPISLFVQPNTDKYIFEWVNKYVTDNYHLVGIADMVDGMQTNYVWKEGLAGFQPKGQNIIYTYERNAAPTASAAPAATVPAN